MTTQCNFDNIIKSLKETATFNCKNHITKNVMERYRSGHNEAVLKTVCPQGREGSNPSLSAYIVKDVYVVQHCLEKYPSG